VFVDGCTLDAVEAMCRPDGELPRDLIAGVASLVDKSLLQQEAGAGGEPRLTTLETIREYALERLELSGEANAIGQQHATFFLAFAEAAELKLFSAELGTWLERLEAEHDNLLAALAWSQAGELRKPSCG
jgi:predicted ATPase